MAVSIDTNISIITLNVNGLNAPIKRYRVADRIKKTRTYNMPPKRDSLQGKRHTQTKSKGMKKCISCRWD